MKRVFAIMVTCSFALSAHAACYRVYKSDRLIHQSSDAPVDTRYNYHETVPQRFGQGSTLVYEGDGENCLGAETPLSVARSYSNQDTEANRQGQQLRPKADRG